MQALLNLTLDAAASIAGQRASRGLRRAFVLFLIAAIPACSERGPKVPTESDARQVFESVADFKTAERLGLVELRSFKKTNGKEGSGLLAGHYVVEFEAVVAYPKGRDLECLGEAGRRSFACRGIDPRAVGAVETIKSEMPFEKTEKGWRGADEKIY